MRFASFIVTALIYSSAFMMVSADHEATAGAVTDVATLPFTTYSTTGCMDIIKVQTFEDQYCSFPTDNTNLDA